MKNNILVTGSSGFIGVRFVAEARRRGANVRCVLRGDEEHKERDDLFFVSDYDENVDWSVALKNIDTVVHLAALTSPGLDTDQRQFYNYLKINVLSVINLAKQAAQAGVKRFIFMSSTKVYGDNSTPSTAFKTTDSTQPNCLYGYTKASAEYCLFSIAEASKMEITILRPPLVYGREVKNNFNSLLKLTKLGLPLPFGNIVDNRRSMVYVGNLVDLMSLCCIHPAAGNRTFLVSDGEDISTRDLIMRMGLAVGCKTRLFRFPIHLIYLFCRIFGKISIYNRIVGSMQVDISDTQRILGWSPPFSISEGLREFR